MSDTNKEKKKRILHKPKYIHNGILYEIVYDPVKKTANFIYLHQSKARQIPRIEKEDEIILPRNPPGILEHGLVLLPSGTEEYGTEEDLIRIIRNYIQKYVYVSDFFLKILPYYILLTWMYDKFYELPYLRAIGDKGVGKSRLLNVLAEIAYKSTKTTAATSTAALFRIISSYNGTLILDEADIERSDTKNELVKILNTGFQKDAKVSRASGENFGIETFYVYSPKILGTRERFQDEALESRCIVERMDYVEFDKLNVPLNLDDSFLQDAKHLRNMCLLWRLRNYHRDFKPSKDHDPQVSSRLNQIVAPLAGMIKDPEVISEVRKHIREYSKELKDHRRDTIDGMLLEIIMYMVENGAQNITMRSISRAYEIVTDGKERSLSPRKIGYILREQLGLKSIKKMGGYTLDLYHYNKVIDRLKNKFGITDEHMNDMTVGSSINDLKKTCLS